MAEVAGAVVLLLVLWGFVQFALLIVYGYLAPARADPAPDGEIELAASGLLRLDAADRFHVFFLIACLDEAAVIGDTVAAALREDPTSTVVVVDDGCDDELYDQAVRVVTDSRQASISYVQRRLRIGYNRAARMIERMEREGLISAADHSGKRQIVSRDAREDAA